MTLMAREDKAYTIFAESMGRSGYARGTLATAKGMEANIPELRSAPLLTMADMGMGHDMASMDSSTMKGMDHSSMKGMDHSKMDMSGSADPFYAFGSGLIPTAANGGKFLSYSDLRAQKPLYEDREPTREVELRLLAGMVATAS